MGWGAGDNVTTTNNVIRIESNGANVRHSCFIGNISRQPAIGGDQVFITSDGKLGTVNTPIINMFQTGQ